MKPESLHALLIDRELGELPPETEELLQEWLAEHPETAAALPSIRRTLATASATVRRFPELARPEEPPQPKNIISFPALRFRFMPLAWAASILILLGGAAWLGFHAGHQSAQSAMAGNQRKPAPILPSNTAKRDGPWAHYTLASDSRGGLTVVRND